MKYNRNLHLKKLYLLLFVFLLTTELRTAGNEIVGGLEGLMFLPKEMRNIISEFTWPEEERERQEENDLKYKCVRTYTGESSSFFKWMLYVHPDPAQTCLYFVYDENKEKEDWTYQGGSTLWKIKMQDLPQEQFGQYENNYLSVIKNKNSFETLERYMPYASKVLSFKDEYKIADFGFSFNFSSVAVLLLDSNEEREKTEVQGYTLRTKKCFYRSTFEKLNLGMEGYTPYMSIATNGKDILLNLPDPSHTRYSTYLLQRNKQPKKLATKSLEWRTVKQLLKEELKEEFVIKNEEEEAPECSFVDSWDDCHSILWMGHTWGGESFYIKDKLNDPISNDFWTFYNHQDGNGYFHSNFSTLRLPFVSSDDQLKENFIKKGIFTKAEIDSKPSSKLKEQKSTTQEPPLKKQCLEND